jgi:hypothetical protein
MNESLHTKRTHFIKRSLFGMTRHDLIAQRLGAL